MNERLAFNYGTAARAGVGDRVERPPVASEVLAREARGEARRDWAFLGLMAFSAVLFFRPQDTIPALNALHLAEMTAIAATIALLHGRARQGLPPLHVTPEVVGVVALGAVMLGTAPFSIWMGGAVSTFTDLYFKVMLIFVLMVCVLSSPKRIDQLTWLLVVATGYIAFRAVFDYARGVNLIENGRVQGALGGMFRNPNDLAMNLVSILPFAAAFAVRPGRAMRRLVALACVLLMIGAIVASHSRGGFLGLCLMLVVLAMMLLKRRPGLVISGAFAVLLSIPLLPESYVDRLASITDESQDETGSREARRTLYREAWAAFLANPLTGVGAGQFRNYNPEDREAAWRETHSVPLQVAAELGIGGIVVFTFLVVCGFRAVRQTRVLLRRASGSDPPRGGLLGRGEFDTFDTQRIAVAAALAGWLVCAQFASVAYHWMFYYLLALAVAPREILAHRLRLSRKLERQAASGTAEVGA